jgi:hypothetical protein
MRTQPHIVIVCLPADTPPQRLLTQATTMLASNGFPNHTGMLAHFATTGRRTKHLIQPCRGTATGGPIRLLDLAGMRIRAQRAAYTRWQVFHEVTTGTPAAKPFWHFARRHHDQPDRYPLHQAQQDYLSQPRLQALAAHNAIPGQPCPLPTEQVEAFQTGAQAYSALGWLQSVPGDALCTPTGWWTPTSGQLTDITAYLQAANQLIDQANRDTHLLALALAP